MTPDPIIELPGQKKNGNDPRLDAMGRSFDIHEWSGSGPDYLHVHHSDDEAWHILEGTLTFKFPDKEIEAPAGATVFVPAGLPHMYYEAHGPTRYLIILTPRLRDLIAELHLTPRAEHRNVLRRLQSDMVE